MRVSFLDVGQGSATLLSCPNSHRDVLIDSGDSSENYPYASEKFLKGLQSRVKDKKIELALLTHPHPDHSSGFLKLLELMEVGQFEIEEYADNGANDADTEIEEKIRALASTANITYHDVAGESLRELPLCQLDGQNLALSLHYPRSRRLKKRLQCPANLNNCSLVTSFTVHGFNVVLMADALLGWENAALALQRFPLPTPAHVLLTGHHANRSSGSAFIAKLSPLLSIVSAGQPHLGRNASLGYPRSDSLQVLAKNSTQKRFSASLPQYTLASCRRSSENGQCRWTESVVPTTLLATTVLGSIDVFIRPHSLCVEAEHLKTAVQFQFNNESLASNLGQH